MFDDELGREWKAFCRRADRMLGNNLGDSGITRKIQGTVGWHT